MINFKSLACDLHKEKNVTSYIFGWASKDFIWSGELPKKGELLLIDHLKFVRI